MDDGGTSDQAFRSLVDAVEEYAIFTLDTDGRVRTWNAGAERIKGYAAGDIVGEHFSVFYTEEASRSGVPADNLSTAARDGTVEDEGWRVTADGERFWANVTITAIRSDSGELEGFAKVTRDMTERREAEQRLEAQADRLERQRDELASELNEVFDRISDGFYALDDDLRFRYVNDHAADVLGLDGTVIGGSIRDEVPMTDAFEAALAEALETQDPVIFDDYYAPVDRWFHNAIYPSASGLSVYFREVTDEKRRERELKRYEATVETVWDGVTMLDADDRFVVVNEAFCRLSGYDRDDLVGAPATLILEDATYERAGRLFEEMVDGRMDTVRFEYDLQRADGGTVPVETRFGPYEYDDGSVGGVGVIRDVSERLENQRRLEASERRYRTLVEHFPNGIVALFDEALCYTAMGGRLLDEESVETDELVGESVLDRYPDDIVSTIEPHFRGALDGDHSEFEVEYLGRHFLAHTLPVTNDLEAGAAGMLMVQDITKRREYQHRLEQSNERLEQFAYAASHDLQEPLRMVSSYLRLIDQRSDELDDELEEFLEFAVDGADRMREMVTGLLEYSRVDAQGDTFEQTDLNAVLDDVMADLQVKIDEYEAEITIESLPEAAGDPSQLRQLFQNVLENAIEYSGEQPPKVHVGAERNGTHWQVSVRDEGIGIDPSDQERIFEIFQRLHTVDEHAGAGIGLALCERIVERHGGDLWVESKPGEGSTFRWTLPSAP